MRLGIIGIIAGVVLAATAGAIVFFTRQTASPGPPRDAADEVRGEAAAPEPRNEALLPLLPPEPAPILPPEPTTTSQAATSSPAPLPQAKLPTAPTSTAPATTTIPEPREPQEFVVHIYSATRVDPAYLTIRVGDTVTFINDDDELHWPGADPHPTHSSLPTFDALGGISQGQSYSHTFRRAGIYSYHEHLTDPSPPTLGTINVLP